MIGGNRSFSHLAYRHDNGASSAKALESPHECGAVDVVDDDRVRLVSSNDQLRPKSYGAPASGMAIGHVCTALRSDLMGEPGEAGARHRACWSPKIPADEVVAVREACARAGERHLGEIRTILDAHASIPADDHAIVDVGLYDWQERPESEQEEGESIA
jgi:hypothetical protein